ncbi:MAG: hypothetical protein KatS3mg057_0313 [Herpetosiphonaceae bacterium]|nr:MAG: hypothetical protein KatS3mg057_0313 [Herpetosiphonaceae bacterium]
MALSAGGSHSCALLADGTARCWGYNYSGQLGDGTTVSSPSPVVVGGATPLTDIVALSAGGYHSCALLADGTARCWGNNWAGQLGDGTTTDSASPVVVGGATPLMDIVALSVGGYHSCALVADGSARCWGANWSGQLGDGTSTSSPLVVGGATPLTDIMALSAGDAHSCALLSDGTARCWGANWYGQLGDGTTTDSASPVVVGGTSPLTDIVALSAGGVHSCALLADGTARCWGNNWYGQLGDGTTTSSPSPVVVGGATPLTDIVALSAGWYHSCALLADGTARCWGDNYSGQLGDGTTTSSPSPVVVGGATPLTDIVALSAGWYHSCALLADGSARCWGANWDGQLGDGTTTSSPSPVVVGGATPLTDIVALSAGWYHSCALLADGTARCWGANWDGQLGDGTTTRSPSPVVVGGATPLTDIVALSTGGEHSCAVLDDGSARCWGDNWAGQLGDGTRMSSPSPVVVGGGDAADGHCGPQRREGLHLRGTGRWQRPLLGRQLGWPAGHWCLWASFHPSASGRAGCATVHCDPAERRRRSYLRAGGRRQCALLGR